MGLLLGVELVLLESLGKQGIFNSGSQLLEVNHYWQNVNNKKTRNSSSIAENCAYLLIEQSKH